MHKHTTQVKSQYICTKKVIHDWFNYLRQICGLFSFVGKQMNASSDESRGRIPCKGILRN